MKAKWFNHAAKRLAWDQCVEARRWTFKTQQVPLESRIVWGANKQGLNVALSFDETSKVRHHSLIPNMRVSRDGAFKSKPWDISSLITYAGRNVLASSKVEKIQPESPTLRTDSHQASECEGALNLNFPSDLINMCYSRDALRHRHTANWDELGQEHQLEEQLTAGWL